MMHFFKRKIFWFALFATSILPQLDAQVQYKIIPFTDIKPEGFPMQFCWNSLGIDPSDNVYIAFGNNNEWIGGEEDMALFRYNNNLGIRKCLGTYNDVLDKADNRLADEIVSKGHTDIVYMNGRMYIGTQPNASPMDDLSDYRGSHLLAYDIALDSMIDLSKDLPDGVVQKNKGIISLTAFPSMNYIVGFGNPTGDLIYYNTVTSSIDRVVSGTKVNNNITRTIIPGQNGNVIYSWGWEKVYEYDFVLDETTKTVYGGGKPFWSCKAVNKEGSIAYVADPEGSVFKLNVNNLSLTTLGTINPSGGGILCIALSADESMLYSIPGQKPYQLIGMNTSTGTTSVIYTFPDEFGTASYTFTGNNIVDSKNYMYFSRHQFNSNNSNGDYDAELVVINVNTDLTENHHPEFTLQSNFNTNVKDEADTIKVSDIDDGDDGIQLISITTNMDNNNISDPEITYCPEKQEALVSFKALSEGVVNLSITVSDDNFGTAGEALEISKNISISISPTYSAQNVIASAHIYPIPTSDILICDFQNEQFDKDLAVKIYSMNGSLVFEKRFDNASGKVNMNISALKSGNYTLNICSNHTEIVNSPIVVKH